MHRVTVATEQFSTLFSRKADGAILSILQLRQTVVSLSPSLSGELASERWQHRSLSTTLKDTQYLFFRTISILHECFEDQAALSENDSSVYYLFHFSDT